MLGGEGAETRQETLARERGRIEPSGQGAGVYDMGHAHGREGVSSLDGLRSGWTGYFEHSHGPLFPGAAPCGLKRGAA